MLGKVKGKAALVSAPALPKVDLPSPPSMEALMADSHMEDPDKEVVFDLSSEFRAPVIKKVLDLLQGQPLSKWRLR